MKLQDVFTAALLPPLLLGAAIILNSGCQNKEKILDVKTPGGQVEVTRDRDTGTVNVDASKQKPIVDVQTPGGDVEVKHDPARGGVEVETTKK